MVARQSAIHRQVIAVISIVFFVNLNVATADVLAHAEIGPDKSLSPSTVSDYGRLPLAFIRNNGQLDERIKFYGRGSGHALYFSNDGITLVLVRNASVTSPDESVVESIRLKPIASQEQPVLIAERQLPGYINFFRGRDKNDWQSRVPTFAAVRYQQLYPGIDLRFHGDNDKLEYDFIVSPGASPGDIVMAYDGIENLAINTAGELIVSLGAGELVQQAPYIYQEIDGHRKQVAGAFKLIPNIPGQDGKRWAYGFELAAYDSSRPLIIDPILSYSTYLGGSNHDQANEYCRQ